MRPLVLITLVLLPSMFSLSGCETVKIATTPKTPVDTAAKEAGQLQVTHPGTQHYLWGEAKSRPSPRVIGECKEGPVEALTAAIWVPIAAKLVMDKISERTTDYVKQAKAESSRSFPFKAVVQSDSIRNGSCVVLYRGAPVGMKVEEPTKSGEPAALVVLKIKMFGQDAYQLTPVYAYVKKSISTTECTAKCSDPDQADGKINVAVAISAKAPITTALKDMEIKNLGTATTTIRGLALRTASDDPSGIGESSALLALPPSGAFVELSVAMTELGNIGGDPDVALGEIQAATAALSEGTLAEIKAYYDRKAAD
ncbi:MULTISPECIES: hypothetical protein [Pseudomonas syringae group]|uniref:hypothetical protein n=1 Tax=Pseudomonas syringae group TaxID=136849 RepID=UPI000F06ABD8|nr:MULTISPECIES: hypothetical protein [Pseudomonas syringae group]MBI6766680.1 hypothetical protein [Pseudomonas syringae]MBI6786199.1 hypothetical protein [Pseudomonas syringae]